MRLSLFSGLTPTGLACLTLVVLSAAWPQQRHLHRHRSFHQTHPPSLPESVSASTLGKSVLSVRHLRARDAAKRAYAVAEKVKTAVDQVGVTATTTVTKAAAAAPTSRASRVELLSASTLFSYSSGGATVSPSPKRSIAPKYTSSVAALPSVKYPADAASEAGIVEPQVGSSTLHGASSNDPTTQYLNVSESPLLKLASNLLKVGANGALTTDYGIAPDTGTLEVSSSSILSNLKYKPHLSRDGGKGGYLNGEKLFVFCDTGSYTPPTQSKQGDFLGFVSSSVAIDKGSNGMYSKPLTLEDGTGEWSCDAGRMRGAAPLTSGEQAYNIPMQGQGHRYAVWPESSLIPLNQSHALMYAPIIYMDVNMITKAWVYEYTGATLLTFSISEKGGPHVDRPAAKLFNQDEVEWGTIGGLRSYGASGFGGNDGKVYLFGNTPGGLLLSRVDSASVADRSAYEYYSEAGTWDSGMQAPESTAWFIKGHFMDGDMFYSPRHLTFIFVYLTPYADNTFYYRYLQADHPILPSFAGGKDDDYVENIVKYSWSDEQVLYKAASGLAGHYIYAGGVHQGYFDEDDITNGGSRMLLSWTAPTGQNPASMDSEYQIVTAEIEWK